MAKEKAESSTSSKTDTETNTQDTTNSTETNPQNVSAENSISEETNSTPETETMPAVNNIPEETVNIEVREQPEEIGELVSTLDYQTFVPYQGNTLPISAREVIPRIIKHHLGKLPKGVGFRKFK
jgi:hypothetical protein